jgi:hypothetical protein
MLERQRQRRTLGNGPPPDLLFGELAYSDGDGLIHVGRPDGTARSFAPGEAGPHTHDYAALVHGHPWSAITDTPATYPPSTHSHSQYAEEETGIWVPSIIGGTQAGACTYTERSGHYTRMDNLWTLYARLVWTGHTGTGNLNISGTPAIVGPLARRGAGMVYAAIYPAAPHTYPVVSPRHGLNQVAINSAAIGTGAIVVQNVPPSGEIQMIAIYWS